MKTYHADSLEDIAKMFDENARKANIAAGRCKGTLKTYRIAEAATWNRAADILRDTELKVTSTGK